MTTNFNLISRLASLALVAGLSACGGDVDSSSSSSSTNSTTSITSSLTSSSSSSSSSIFSSPPVASSSSSYGYSEPQPLPNAASQSVVRFVYFIEQGESFDQARYDAIIEQAFNMQQYWYEQFDGTFYLYNNIVDVIYADHEPNWYLTQNDGIHGDQRWYRLGNIKNEVFRKLDINNFDSQVRVVNYPTTRSDGKVGANFGGAWMDGDDLGCLVGENNGFNYPYPDGIAAHCAGHVAHEFGHVFGLEHSGPDNDCMQWGFYDYLNSGQMCDFFEDNRNIVKNRSQNQPFLIAEPGQVVTPQGYVESR